MTGRQEYDRTKDRQRILGNTVYDKKNFSFIANAVDTADKHSFAKIFANL